MATTLKNPESVIDAEVKTVRREDLCICCSDRLFGSERKCPYCGTGFPRNGKQVYCTKACTVKASEARRAPDKRTYNRAYQRARRARMKAVAPPK